MAVNWGTIRNYDHGLIDYKGAIDSYFLGQQNARQNAKMRAEKADKLAIKNRNKQLSDITKKHMGPNGIVNYDLAGQDYFQLTGDAKGLQEFQKLAQTQQDLAIKRQERYSQGQTKLANQLLRLEGQFTDPQKRFEQQNIAWELGGGRDLFKQDFSPEAVNSAKGMADREELDAADEKVKQKEVANLETEFGQYVKGLGISDFKNPEQQKQILLDLYSKPFGRTKVAQSFYDDISKGKSIEESMALMLSSIDKHKQLLDAKRTNIPVTAQVAEKFAGITHGIDSLDKLMVNIPKVSSGEWSPILDPARKYLNPWDEAAQGKAQYIATVKQTIGKGLEGGVLRKEDEHKYDKIIPKLSDTDSSMINKATQLRKMMTEKYRFELESLRKFNYDVRGWDLEAYELVGGLTKKQRDRWNFLKKEYPDKFKDFDPLEE